MNDLDSSQTPPDVVSKSIADGDRQRRVRDIGRLVWRIAPAVAGAALVAAAGRRWLGWPMTIPVVVFAAGVVTVAVVEYFGRRGRPVTDEIASRLDTDAGLGGELRSAAWFSARDGRDAWTELHLTRAASRMRGVDWTSLYRPAPAARPRAATVAMMVAAIGLTVALPGRAARFGAGAGSASPAAATDAMKMLELSPELQKKLDELLSGIERNKMTPAEAAAKAGDLKDLLAQLGKLDPETLKKLEAAAANTGTDPKQKIDAQALADRVKRDANAPSLPADLKKALQDVANQLDKTKKSENASAQKKEGQDGPPGQAPSASPDQSAAKPTATTDSPESSSMQMAREASAGAGQQQMMMMSNGAQSSDPNPGQGGNKSGAGKMSAIEQALKHELVEAASDQLGDNVTTEIHKKTEQGHATASFTHGAAATFDRGHASAPPPVPDARRAQVQNYFIRKQ